MKRPVMMALIKMCGEALLLAILAGIAIGIIGNLNHWDTALEYSDAFFIAGSLLIIAGASSRLAAGQDLERFRGLYADSYRNMSPAERADFIVNASSSVRLVVIGLLLGILLMLISELVAIL